MTICKICGEPGRVYSYGVPKIEVLPIQVEGSVVADSPLKSVSLCDFHYLLWDRKS